MTVARANVERVRAGQTAQGFYVLGADGAFFGYNNNRSIERVLRLMDAGLQRYSEHDARAVEIDAELVDAPFCHAPAESTSVVRVFTRIRPLPADAPPQNRYLGRDFLWITRGEVLAIAREPESDFPLPATLASRLVRYHLVDNVRGEPPFWQPAEVKATEFRVRRTDSAQQRYSFEGRFSMATADGARGIDGSLSGELSIDVEAERIRRLRAYASAQAWGRGRWTPNPPAGRFPLVFALVDADDPVSRTVPPQAVGCGQRYLDSRLPGR